MIKHSDGLPEKQICSSKLQVPDLLTQEVNKHKVYQNTKTRNRIKKQTDKRKTDRQTVKTRHFSTHCIFVV